MYCAVDYETYYSTDYSVRDLGNRGYVLDPRFEAPIVSVVSDDGIEFSGPPEDFDWSLIAEHEWVSWNTLFDRTVHERLVELEKIPSLAHPRLGRWHDASHLSVYLCGGRALKTAMGNFYGLDVKKDVRDEMKNVHYSSLDPEQRESWLEYALLDSKHCLDFWVEYLEDWPEEERQISLHQLDMCMRGVYIDYDRALKYRTALERALKLVESKIPWVGTLDTRGKPVPVTSPKQIALACADAGIPKPKTTNAKDSKFEKWFEDYGDQADFVRQVQVWRRYNKLLKSILTIISRCEKVDDGHMMSYQLMYFGAHTGRWSGAGGLNMQNLHREAVKIGRTSVDIRSLIIPKPGKKFAIVDYSQIECRITFALAGDQEFLDKCETVSPYQAHAEATMGWTGGNLKKENPKLYQLAKARSLGLGFGCGPAKFVDVAKIMAGLTITLEEAEATVKDYRSQNHLVMRLWSVLNTDFKRSLNGDYSVELPSGRTLDYFGVTREDGRSFGYDYKAAVEMNAFAWKFYGGKLTENLVQATARDCLRDAILKIEEHYPVVMHVHDEVIVEVDCAEDLEKISDIMRVRPEWFPGLPLDCEGTLAEKYQK